MHHKYTRQNKYAPKIKNILYFSVIVVFGIIYDSALVKICVIRVILADTLPS